MWDTHFILFADSKSNLPGSDHQVHHLDDKLQEESQSTQNIHYSDFVFLFEKEESLYFDWIVSKTWKAYKSETWSYPELSS